MLSTNVSKFHLTLIYFVLKISVKYCFHQELNLNSVNETKIESRLGKDTPIEAKLQLRTACE